VIWLCCIAKHSLAILRQPIAKHMLAILANSYRLNREDFSRFVGLGGVNNAFSHVSLILVATFSIFAKSLLTNFLAPVHCAPPCFWIRMCGFLKVRRSWEPSSSINTGKFSPIQTYRKASAVNVCWTEHYSYLSFSIKFSDWHFLAWHKPAELRSTARVWNPQGISNLSIKLDCRLSDNSFLAHASLKR
jgi:hypothetical protein